MIKDKYLKRIKDIISTTVERKKIKVFIFGSSIRDKKFGDIDIGINGEIDEKMINRLRDIFEESTLPYFFDIINFNKVDKSFKENVMEQKILWIKR